MKNLKRKRIILKIISFLLVLGVGNIVRAGTSHNLRGWAWSENIGWISFNNVTGGGAIDYGVNLDEFSGEMTGFAWSENIGWIDFDPGIAPPDAPNHSVCVDFPGPGQADCDGVGDYDASGWAKILTYASNTAGWLKMRDSSYGVSFNSSTEELVGWAWSDVLGWVSFNCENRVSCSSSDYKVYYENSTPTAAMSGDVSGDLDGCTTSSVPWETFNGGNTIFTVVNDSTDPDSTNPPDLNDHIASSTWSLIDNSDMSFQYGPSSCSSVCNYTLSSNTPAGGYTVQLVVEDIMGRTSTAATNTIIVYQEAIADFMCSVGVEDDWIPCNDPSLNNIVKGQTIYVGDLPTLLNRSYPSGVPGASIKSDSRDWYQDGNPIASGVATTSVVINSSSTEIRLEITDSEGRNAYQDYRLGSIPSVPRYREVSPGG